MLVMAGRRRGCGLREGVVRMGMTGWVLVMEGEGVGERGGLMWLFSWEGGG